jgi:hypothetical protein
VPGLDSTADSPTSQPIDRFDPERPDAE